MLSTTTDVFAQHQNDAGVTNVGEPSNHTGYDERCGQISHAKKGDNFGGWNDAKCSRQRGYLCEACSNVW
eukprot:m.792228 g.792228  ORF g.792228 m.792228 type:complete len:70 (+) comp23331_c0_seq53:171-380(+)